MLLGALWWAWAAYAWLTNTLNAEEGAFRLAVFGSIAAMLVVALATRHAFDTEGVIFEPCLQHATDPRVDAYIDGRPSSNYESLAPWSRC